MIKIEISSINEEDYQLTVGQFLIKRKFRLFFFPPKGMVIPDERNLGEAISQAKIGKSEHLTLRKRKLYYAEDKQLAGVGLVNRLKSVRYSVGKYKLNEIVESLNRRDFAGNQSPEHGPLKLDEQLDMALLFRMSKPQTPLVIMRRNSKHIFRFQYLFNEQEHTGKFVFRMNEMKDGFLPGNIGREIILNWMTENNLVFDIVLGPEKLIPIPYPNQDALDITVESERCYKAKTLSQSVLSEKFAFENVANTLTSDELNPIIKILLEAQNVSSDCVRWGFDLNSPYVAIMAPSGTGKTLMRYAVASQHGKELFPGEKLDILTLHLILSKSVNSRLIYRAVGQPSAEILKLCSLDYFALEKWIKYINPLSEDQITDLMLSTSVFMDRSDGNGLLTVGLLDALLTAEKLLLDNHAEVKEFKYSRMTLSEFYKKWILTEDVGNAKKLICIFLDEFHVTACQRLETKTGGVHDYKLLIFCKNLIRALGLTCVVMGTDTSGVELITDECLASVAFRGGNRRPWVYVINKLPKAKSRNIPGFTEFYNLPFDKNDEVWKSFLDWILDDDCPPSPRPLLMIMLFEEFVKWYASDTSPKTPFTGLLHVILRIVGLLLLRKDSLMSEESLMGQCEMYFPRWRASASSTAPRGDYPASLLNTFFADLCRPADASLHFNDARMDDICFVLYRKTLRFAGSNDTPRNISQNTYILMTLFSVTKWEPRTYFAYKDELLFLLLSWNSNYPLSLNFANQPVYDINHDINLNLQRISRLMTDGHVRASDCQDDDYLKNLAHLALIKASHMGGFSGTPLTKAIPCFISFMIDSKTSRAIVLDPECDFMALADKLVPTDCIPFLGPINDSLSGLQKAFPTGNFGQLSEIENADRSDWKAMVASAENHENSRVLIVEVKNTEEPHHDKDLIDIIEKGKSQSDGKPVIIMIIAKSLTELRGSTWKELDNNTHWIFKTEVIHPLSSSFSLKLVNSSLYEAQSHASLPKTVVLLVSLTELFGKEYGVDHADGDAPVDSFPQAKRIKPTNA